MENMLGNTLGTSKTYWELQGNIAGTHREPGKNEIKSFSPLPLPKLKRKKAMHLELSHWLHEISLLKRVGHHFGPRLIPLAKNTLQNNKKMTISHSHPHEPFWWVDWLCISHLFCFAQQKVNCGKQWWVRMGKTHLELVASWFLSTNYLI